MKLALTARAGFHANPPYGQKMPMLAAGSDSLPSQAAIHLRTHKNRRRPKSCARCMAVPHAPHGWARPWGRTSPSEPKQRESEATSAQMVSEKPKATPAQQPSDHLDKWIASACENDPIEVVEFIEGEAGPPLSKAEIRHARDNLSRWQSPTDFQSAVHLLCKRCNSSDWFNRPNLKFLHDAFVLAKVVGHLAVDQVRLASPADQWPDGYVRVGNRDHNVEVTSAHGGRKLGAEYKNVTKPELVSSIAAPVGKIARDLDA